MDDTIRLSVSVPDGLTIAHRVALRQRLRRAVDEAKEQFMKNEVDPNGCWCGLEHRTDCKNWTLPY